MSITRFRCLGGSVAGIVVACYGLYEYINGKVPLWKTVTVGAACIAGSVFLLFYSRRFK